MPTSDVLAEIEAQGPEITTADLNAACRMVQWNTKNSPAIRALLREYAGPSANARDISAERRRAFVAALRQVPYRLSLFHE